MNNVICSSLEKKNKVNILDGENTLSRRKKCNLHKIISAKISPIRGVLFFVLCLLMCFKMQRIGWCGYCSSSKCFLPIYMSVSNIAFCDITPFVYFGSRLPTLRSKRHPRRSGLKIYYDYTFCKLFISPKNDSHASKTKLEAADCYQITRCHIQKRVLHV